MRRAIFLTISVFLFFVFSASDLSAEDEQKGKLDSFEEEVESPDAKRRDTGAITAQDIAVQSSLELLMNFFMLGLSQTGIENFGELHKELRSSWSPALPTVRFEPAYQYLAGGLHGVSAKLEAGYLVVGADAEYTRYFEKSPKSNLDLIGAHFLLRSIFTRHFGVNMALGFKQVRGLARHTGFDFGFPFNIYFTNSFIFDILPFMAVIGGSNMYDVGAGLSYKYKFIGARAGYRAIFVDDERLHGPRIGLFFQW